MTPLQSLVIEDQIFQLITLAFVLFGIGFEIYKWIRTPSERYFAMANMLWMIHTIYFYITVIVDRYTTLVFTPFFGSYTVWSSILRLHIIGTIVVLEFFRFQQRKLRLIKAKVDSDLIIANHLANVEEKGDDK